MKLSKLQFNKLLNENRLTLSLIGMSNVGKTYWSNKLTRLNFKHLNCDDLIEIKLAHELKALGYSGIRDVSRWMGQPYEKKFSANQKKYLSFEKEIMENIFMEVKKGKSTNMVIDTTGSIIHTNKNICTKLKKCSLVVYIRTTKKMQEEMFKKYIQEPKPVVFGKSFNQKKSETTMQTLKRCYRKLLKIRDKLYIAWADVIIDRINIKPEINVNQFISLIKNSL